MSTNASSTTPNYGLSQWAEGDRILREDFNHDNAAIDAALHTQAAQTAAAVKAVEEKISLVRLFSRTLTSAASSLTIDLSAIDLSQYMELELYMNDFSNTTRSSQAFHITLSNGSESLVCKPHALFSDYKYILRYRFANAGGLLAYDDGKRNESGSLAVTSVNGSVWANKTLTSLKTITLSVDSGTLAAGAEIVLYGRKK